MHAIKRLKYVTGLAAFGLCMVGVPTAQAATDVNWHIEGALDQILPYTTTTVHGIVMQSLSTQPVSELGGLHAGDRVTVDISMDLNANKATGVTFRFGDGNVVFSEGENAVFNDAGIGPYSMGPSVEMLGNRISARLANTAGFPAPSELWTQFQVAGAGDQPSFADVSKVLSQGDASLLSNFRGSLFAGPSSAISHFAEIRLSVNAVTVTAVPEPSTLPMLGLGLMGVAAMVRRGAKPARRTT